MTKHNVENERIKRKYFGYLEEVKSIGFLRKREGKFVQIPFDLLCCAKAYATD